MSRYADAIYDACEPTGYTRHGWYDCLYSTLETLLEASRLDAQAVADIHDLTPCLQAGMPPETVARVIALGGIR